MLAIVGALVSAVVAADLCRQLYTGGVRDFHFYTLNRAEQAFAICQLLGLRPNSDPSIRHSRLRGNDEIE